MVGASGLVLDLFDALTFRNSLAFFYLFLFYLFYGEGGRGGGCCTPFVRGLHGVNCQELIKHLNK